MFGGEKMDGFHGLQKAAQMVGISVNSLRKGVRAGRFPHVMNGNRYLVSPAQVQATLKREALANQRSKEGND